MYMYKVTENFSYIYISNFLLTFLIYTAIISGTLHPFYIHFIEIIQGIIHGIYLYGIIQTNILYFKYLTYTNV